MSSGIGRRLAAGVAVTAALAGGTVISAGPAAANSVDTTTQDLGSVDGFAPGETQPLFVRIGGGMILLGAYLACQLAPDAASHDNPTGECLIAAPPTNPGGMA